MATSAQEKTPSEVIEIQADFASVLLAGETITPANASVTVKNSLTDADATSAIVVSGSVAVSGAIISAQFQGGSSGDSYTITFSTGATSLGNKYELESHLLIRSKPTEANPLVNRREVKDRLQLTTTSDDALIDDLIMSASAYIRHRCGREFTFGVYTDVLRPDDEAVLESELLTLSHWPVHTVDSVTLRTSDGVTTAVDMANVKYNSEGAIWLINGVAWYRFPDENEVVYRAGYLRIPDEVREAAKSLVVWFYRLVTREGLTSERIGDYLYRRETLADMPRDMHYELPDGFIEGVIQRYKRREITVL